MSAMKNTEKILQIDAKLAHPCDNALLWPDDHISLSFLWLRITYTVISFLELKRSCGIVQRLKTVLIAAIAC